MSKKTKSQSKTKANPILWFLFAIIVPLTVAITIIIIIFSVAGFNVIDWAKSSSNHIPVISSVVKTDKEKNEQRTEKNYQDKIAKKDEEIDELKSNVTDLEATVYQLKQDIATHENAATEKPDEEPAQEEKNSKLKSLTASFEVMDPEQSALILQDLEEDTVIKLLQGLPEDVRAGIFEEMEPKKAAQYTKAFLKSDL